MGERRRRESLEHVSRYLKQRDGTDKLLKVLRYSAALAAWGGAPGRAKLERFDASLGSARKALRLGKFLQYALDADRALAEAGPSVVAVGKAAESLYYGLEQVAFLSKAGLLERDAGDRVGRVTPYVELVVYACALAHGARVAEAAASRERALRSEAARGNLDEEARKRLLADADGAKDACLTARLEMLQDFCDALLAVGDIRGKGHALKHPAVTGVLGLVSAGVSVRKVWRATAK